MDSGRTLYSLFYTISESPNEPIWLEIALGNASPGASIAYPASVVSYLPVAIGRENHAAIADVEKLREYVEDDRVASWSKAQ